MNASSLHDVFAVVTRRLPAAGVDFLLVGGFAVNHYGYVRATLDVDFMVAAGDSDAVHEVMVAAGFTNFARHNVVAFYSRPGDALRVDFLQVDPSTFRTMQQDAESVEVGGCVLRVPALRSVLAMKLFAATHGGPERADKDLPDVAHLVVLNDLDLTEDLLPLCEQYASPDTYQELCRRTKQLTES